MPDHYLLSSGDRSRYSVASFFVAMGLLVSEPREVSAPDFSVSFVADGDEANDIVLWDPHSAGVQLTELPEILSESVIDRPPPPLSGGPKRPSAVANAWQKIQSFTQLQDGWAGENSKPINSKTAEVASDLLRLLPEDMPVPQVAASGDGEVVLTWFGSKGRVEAFVDTEGNLVSLGRFPDGFVDGDELLWDGSLPPELPKLLSRAFA